MKKILMMLILFPLVIGFGMHPPVPSCSIASAEVAFPMETGAVGYWFPNTGAFAVGVSHTFIRVGDDRIPVTLDLDGTIAQEVNQEENTLGGIGVKANFNISTPEKGLSFLPSLGITLLNDFEKFRKAQDILDNYELAVYGTLLMYKW